MTEYWLDWQPRLRLKGLSAWKMISNGGTISMTHPSQHFIYCLDENVECLFTKFVDETYFWHNEKYLDTRNRDVKCYQDQAGSIHSNQTHLKRHWWMVYPQFQNAPSVLKYTWAIFISVNMNLKQYEEDPVGSEFYMNAQPTRTGILLIWSHKAATKLFIQ